MGNIDFEYKQKLLDTGIFRKQNENRYTSQCPFCSDRKKHMYVLIDMTSDIPVLYNCFKCTARGKMNKEFLEFFGIDNITIPRSKYKKKIEPSKAVNSLSTYVDDNDDVSGVCNYIKDRVGHYPTISELQYFQYVSNPKKYVSDYLNSNTNNVSGNVFINRFYFRMTNGGIIGRYHNDEHKFSWLKYKSPLVDNIKGLYTFKLPFDLHKQINVYIAEGVMDVIGLYYNHTHDNNIYIATLGKNYNSGLQYLIDMGIFGNNVNINIFKDSNVKIKDIYIDKNMKELFGKINIYRNVIGDDYGLLPDKIEIEKIII